MTNWLYSLEVGFSLSSDISTCNKIRNTIIWCKIFCVKLRKHSLTLLICLSSWKDLKPCHSPGPALYSGKLPWSARFHCTHPSHEHTRALARYCNLCLFSGCGVCDEVCHSCICTPFLVLILFLHITVYSSVFHRYCGWRYRPQVWL